MCFYFFLSLVIISVACAFYIMGKETGYAKGKIDILNQLSVERNWLEYFNRQPDEVGGIISSKQHKQRRMYTNIYDNHDY